MKRSSLRIGCAFLLMTIMLICSLGVIGAASDPAPREIADTNASGTPEIWVQMVILSEAEEMKLYGSDGTLLQVLTANSTGEAATGLLQPGDYSVRSELGCVFFRLHNNAAVTVLSGNGWSDGERLHLTNSDVGTLTLQRQVSTSELAAENGWLDYVLTGKEERHQVLRFTAEGLHSLVFQGLPFGSYNVYENGVFRGRIIISADSRDITMDLTTTAALVTNRAPSNG